MVLRKEEAASRAVRIAASEPDAGTQDQQADANNCSTTIEALAASETVPLGEQVHQEIRDPRRGRILPRHP